MAPTAQAAAPTTPAAAPNQAKPVVPAPVKPVAKPAPAPEATHKVVIDGQERMLTTTQLLTLAQKNGAVDKRLNEAAQEKKKVAELLKLFEEDPEAAIAKLGKDPGKIINDYLAKKAKRELMSPEEQEKAKLQAELDKLKSEKETTEKEVLTAKQKEIDAKTEKVLEGQLIEAAKKYKLDNTWETLEEMTAVAMEALDLGMTNISPDQIAQEVIRRQQEQIEKREKKLLSKMTPAQLIEYVGKDRFKLMLRESLKDIPSAAKPKPKAPEASKPSNGKAFYRPSEFGRLVKAGKI